MDLVWISHRGKERLTNMCTTHLINAINYISSQNKPTDKIYGVQSKVWVKEMSLTVANRQIKQIDKRIAEIRELNQQLKSEFDECMKLKEEITQLKLQL